MPATAYKRYCEIVTPASYGDALDRIFFDSSNTKTFASPEAKAAFRERWLGRYLRREPHLAHLAFAGAACDPGDLIGYLVGDHRDPAHDRRYDDIGYFSVLAPLTARYPAHLHVNLAPEARGAGIGSMLVSRFLADASEAGVTGAHIVTSAGARNVGFYVRNGFVARHPFDWKGSELVLLGRSLRA